MVSVLSECRHWFSRKTFNNHFVLPTNRLLRKLRPQLKYFRVQAWVIIMFVWLSINFIFYGIVNRSRIIFSKIQYNASQWNANVNFNVSKYRQCLLISDIWTTLFSYLRLIIFLSLGWVWWHLNVYGVQCHYPYD